MSARGQQLSAFDDDMVHSAASSVSDLHAYSNTGASYAYGPPDSSFSDAGDERQSFSASRRDSLALDLRHPPQQAEEQADTISLTSTSAGAAPGARRSRARAFSFLLDREPPSPSTGRSPGGRRASISTLADDPFASHEYEYALRPEEEDEETSAEEPQAQEAVRERRAARSQFQPILKEEMLWMGVSGLAVLGLTATAVVLSVVG